MFDLLAGSFARLVGRPLVEPPEGAEWLYEHAPFAVLAHDLGPDPRFVYANRAAQRLFEYDWDEFMTVRSALSAKPVDRAERARLLAAVERDGFISDYSGTRVAKSGRMFRIEQGIVWQMVDQAGHAIGQAACFGEWHDL